jgi:hypothetical protein
VGASVKITIENKSITELDVRNHSVKVNCKKVAWTLVQEVISQDTMKINSQVITQVKCLDS